MSAEVWVQLPRGDEVLAGHITETPSPTGSTPIVAFEYERTYIADRQAYKLSPELPLSGRSQTPSVHRSMFFAFEDAGPDSWGRELIQTSDDLLARKEGRPLKRLSSLETLLRVPDGTRQGALRFMRNGRPLAPSTPPNFAHDADWDQLSTAIKVFQSSKKNEDVERALQVLFPEGSTAPGGARPKVNVRDKEGFLQLAKFPTSQDRWDVSRWESITLQLAKSSGLDVPDHELVPIADDQSILLINRFDRDSTGRVGYISARSVLMQEDHSHEKASYQDLAAAMTHVCAPAERHELFRRVAFTILVTNADDHMRNHGFLRFDEGWVLSPSFDVNPMRHPNFSSTPITRGGDPQQRSLQELLSIHEEFALDLDHAESILGEVRRGTENWQEVALRTGEDSEAIDFFLPMFEHENSEFAQQFVKPTGAPELPERSSTTARIRRGDLGTGRAVAGGNRGSFAKHLRKRGSAPNT